MMEVHIAFHPQFLHDAKRLAKKYKSFKSDFALFLELLEQNPLLGTDLGKGVRKVRMAISSKGKGKSGGARVCTFCLVPQENGIWEVTLLTIYDKNEIDNVSDEFIKSLLDTL